METLLEKVKMQETQLQELQRDVHDHLGETMAKNDKKIKVLQDRITELEEEMKVALQKKNRGTYDMAGTIKKIADLKQDLKRLQ